MVKVRKDLTGQKFGRWTVIKQAEDYINPKTGQHLAQWLCECDCDNHTIRAVAQTSLNKGLSRSCGCIQKEIASKTNKRYNTYNFCDDYVIGYATNTGKEFYVDLDDYENIKDNCWLEDSHGYIKSADLNNWRKKMYLHRVIMKCENSNIFVDHINHNILDNRKANLRLVTPAQSGYNKGIQPYNTSGIIGYYDAANGWY